MSGGALFGNNTTRSGNKNLVEFKAGRMKMKGKMVYPDNRKGLLYVYQSDDALMHFCWKDRTSGVVEDVNMFLFALHSRILSFRNLTSNNAEQCFLLFNLMFSFLLTK